MVIPSFGGMMVTLLPRVEKSFPDGNLFNEPTNVEPNKNPSCIDLIFTDQPNCVIESGTRPSLDNRCQHQITYCRMNFYLPSIPFF